MEMLLNDFSLGLFIMQAVILLVLILLMRKFAWKPILDALQGREEGIQNALDAAESAKLEMQNLTADNEKLLNLLCVKLCVFLHKYNAIHRMQKLSL